LSGAATLLRGAARKAPRGCALGATLLFCFGCNDEPTARFELEKQSFSAIVLTKTAKRGVFDFRAKKADKLEACSGTVTVTRGLGSSSTTTTSSCTADEDACTKENAAHCFTLGERNVDTDRAKANRFYETACDGEQATACNKLGFSYESGLGIAKDTAKARAFYEKGCTLGGAMACRNAAILLRDGAAGEPDQKAAFALFEKACKGDDAPGCYDVGFSYANARGVEKSYQNAAVALEKSCTGKVAEACAMLGAILVGGGDGLEKNVPRGVSMLIDGCQQDDFQACGNLAVLSSTKVIDDPTAEKRAAWAEKACTGKYAGGCVELALLFERGLGGKKRDLKEALTYQIKACDLDSAIGCNNVGLMMEKGLGIAKNPERAAESYARACKLGLEEACKEAATL